MARSLGRGVLAGAVAGLGASLVMDGFQMLAAPVQGAVERKVRMGRGESEAAIRNDQEAELAKESTTEKTARSVVESVGGALPLREKKAVGRVLHYAFGTLMGAVYGGAAEWMPWVGVGGGAAFATILFAGTDEAALPMLNLASKPGETRAVDHLMHLGSHLVYGATLEAGRKLCGGSREQGTGSRE